MDGRWIRIEGIGVNSGYVYAHAYLYVCPFLCEKYVAVSYLCLLREPRSKVILAAVSTLVSNIIPIKMLLGQAEKLVVKSGQNT